MFGSVLGMSIKDLANKIAATVEEKGAAYGNAIKFSEVVFKELYPQGIPVEHYNNALLMVRVLDKLKRLSTDPNAFGESPWEDIVGYALRGAEIVDNKKKAFKKNFEDKALYTMEAPPDWKYAAPCGSLLGINSVVRGEPKASVAAHLELQGQLIKHGLVGSQGITDEDVYMAVDVLVELLRDEEAPVDLFAEVHITLMNLGWTFEDLHEAISNQG